MTAPTKSSHRVALHRARKREGLVQAGPYWVSPETKQRLDKLAEKLREKKQ